MTIALDQLPDDVDTLKSLVADQATQLHHVAARNEQLESKVTLLQEQLNLALARRYAASSEKISPDQIRLFDEAEVDVETAQAVDAEETTSVPAHTHVRSGGVSPCPRTCLVSMYCMNSRKPNACAPSMADD